MDDAMVGTICVKNARSASDVPSFALNSLVRVTLIATSGFVAFKPSNQYLHCYMLLDADDLVEGVMLLTFSVGRRLHLHLAFASYSAESHPEEPEQFRTST